MKGSEAEEVSRGLDIQIPEANELSQLKTFPSVTLVKDFQ